MKRGVSLGLFSLGLSLLLALSMVGGAGCGRLEFGAGDEDGSGAGKLALTYPYPSSYHAVIDQTELSIRPELVEGVTSFEVSPPLPAGLFFDGEKGKIVGKPTGEADRVKYTITGSGPAGKVTAEIYLTALKGWEVAERADAPDADGGVGECRASATVGCTLRAAVDTSNRQTGKRLILVTDGEIVVNAPLTPILNDLVIAGKGIDATVMTPKPLGQMHNFLKYESVRQVRLENLSVRNFTPADGGAVLVTDGLFEAFEVEFRGNKATNSGAVACVDRGARAHFENVTFLENEALGNPGWGGVISGTGADTKITVHSSTATGNKAIWGSFSYLQTGARLELVNSSLVGNQATTAGTLSSPDSHHRIINSTIAFNTIMGSQSAGLYFNEKDATYEVGNSIIAHNKNATGAEVSCARRDAMGTLTSLGGNVLGDDGGNCAEFFASAGDVVNVNPLFHSITPVREGGHTKTMPIEADSKAIGRGLGALCPARDQRGAARKVGSCDSGAYERQE